MSDQSPIKTLKDYFASHKQEDLKALKDKKELSQDVAIILAFDSIRCFSREWVPPSNEASEDKLSIQHSLFEIFKECKDFKGKSVQRVISLIMEQSEPELQALLFTECAKFIPVPLTDSKNNFWPYAATLFEQTQNVLVVMLDSDLNSADQNSVDNRLVNEIFETSFESKSRSFVSHPGSIDAQFMRADWPLNKPSSKCPTPEKDKDCSSCQAAPHQGNPFGMVAIWRTSNKDSVEKQLESLAPLFKVVMFLDHQNKRQAELKKIINKNWLEHLMVLECHFLHQQDNSNQRARTNNFFYTAILEGNNEDLQSKAKYMKQFAIHEKFIKKDRMLELVIPCTKTDLAKDDRQAKHILEAKKQYLKMVRSNGGKPELDELAKRMTTLLDMMILNFIFHQESDESKAWLSISETPLADPSRKLDHGQLYHLKSKDKAKENLERNAKGSSICKDITRIKDLQVTFRTILARLRNDFTVKEGKQVALYHPLSLHHCFNEIFRVQAHCQSQEPPELSYLPSQPYPLLDGHNLTFCNFAEVFKGCQNDQSITVISVFETGEIKQESRLSKMRCLGDIFGTSFHWESQDRFQGVDACLQTVDGKAFLFLWADNLFQFQTEDKASYEARRPRTEVYSDQMIYWLTLVSHHLVLFASQEDKDKISEPDEQVYSYFELAKTRAMDEAEEQIVNQGIRLTIIHGENPSSDIVKKQLAKMIKQDQDAQNAAQDPVPFEELKEQEREAYYTKIDELTDIQKDLDHEAILDEVLKLYDDWQAKQLDEWLALAKKKWNEVRNNLNLQVKSQCSIGEARERLQSKLLELQKEFYPKGETGEANKDDQQNQADRELAEQERGPAEPNGLENNENMIEEVKDPGEEEKVEEAKENAEQPPADAPQEPAIGKHLQEPQEEPPLVSVSDHLENEMKPYEESMKEAMKKIKEELELFAKDQNLNYKDMIKSLEEQADMNMKINLSQRRMQLAKKQTKELAYEAKRRIRKRAKDKDEPETIWMEERNALQKNLLPLDKIFEEAKTLVTALYSSFSFEEIRAFGSSTRKIDLKQVVRTYMTKNGLEYQPMKPMKTKMPEGFKARIQANEKALDIIMGTKHSKMIKAENMNLFRHVRIDWSLDPKMFIGNVLYLAKDDPDDYKFKILKDLENAMELADQQTSLYAWLFGTSGTRYVKNINPQEVERIMTDYKSDLKSLGIVYKPPYELLSVKAFENKKWDEITKLEMKQQAFSHLVGPNSYNLYEAIHQEPVKEIPQTFNYLDRDEISKHWSSNAGMFSKKEGDGEAITSTKDLIELEKNYRIQKQPEGDKKNLENFFKRIETGDNTFSLEDFHKIMAKEFIKWEHVSTVISNAINFTFLGKYDLPEDLWRPLIAAVKFVEKEVKSEFENQIQAIQGEEATNSENEADEGHADASLKANISKHRNTCLDLEKVQWNKELISRIDGHLQNIQTTSLQFFFVKLKRDPIRRLVCNLLIFLKFRIDEFSLRTFPLLELYRSKQALLDEMKNSHNTNQEEKLINNMLDTARKLKKLLLELASFNINQKLVEQTKEKITLLENKEGDQVIRKNLLIQIFPELFFNEVNHQMKMDLEVIFETASARTFFHQKELEPEIKELLLSLYLNPIEWRKLVFEKICFVILKKDTKGNINPSSSALKEAKIKAEANRLLQKYKDLLRAKKTEISDPDQLVSLTKDFFSNFRQNVSFDIEEAFPCLEMDQKFVEKFVEHADKFESFQDISKSLSEDLRMNNQELDQQKEMFIGCKVSCPICKRKCSKSANHEGLHASCHQVVALGGVKDEDNNPLNFVCPEAGGSKDEENKGEATDGFEIIYDGEPKKLSDIKDWDFDDLNDIPLTKPAQIDLWNYLREDLCEEYSKIGITINSNQLLPIAQTHVRRAEPATYIFLIDGSSSMGGSPWKQVNESIKKFRDQIMNETSEAEENPYVKAGQKITIVQYSHTVKPIIKNQPIQNPIKGISMMHGFTNFDLPLVHAFDLCKEEKGRYLEIYFMTDGMGKDPLLAYETAKTLDVQIKNRMNFSAVAFGAQSSAKQLKSIVKKFENLGIKGKVVNAPSKTSLIDSMRKMIVSSKNSN